MALATFNGCHDCSFGRPEVGFVRGKPGLASFGDDGAAVRSPPLNGVKPADPRWVRFALGAIMEMFIPNSPSCRWLRFVVAPRATGWLWVWQMILAAVLPWFSPAPHPTLPHKGGGLSWLPPPLWGRAGVGGVAIAADLL